jgi:twitching motility protein PilU
MEGKITQDEAMANADSATNMLWLINQATAGEISGQALPPKPPVEKPEEKSGQTAPPSSFNDFKIDMNA